MPDFNIQALHDEIENDPLALGYKNPDSTWKGDTEIANIINNVDGQNSYLINRERVDVGDMRSVTSFNAFDGLSASETDWFTWLTNAGTILLKPHHLADLAGIDGNSRWAISERDKMEAAMKELFQFTGSRAESLWGEFFTVSPGMVGAASNLG